jgi:hypothetical protein
VSWVRRHRAVASLACAALAGAVAVRSARAEEPGAGATPFTLSGSEPLPFSDAELEGALLARLLRPPADGAGEPLARVERTGEGTVVVRIGDQTRVVQLGDRTGPAAARVVALVIADLLSMPAAPAAVAAPPSPAGNPPAAPIPVAAPLIAEAAPAPVRPARGARLGVTGGASKGIGAQELLAAALNVDLVIPLARSRWRWSPSAGLMMMPTRNPGSLDQVSFVGGVGRLLGGRAWGPAEVLLGPFVSAYSIGGSTPHAGVLYGGEAVARLAAPLSSRLRLVVDGRADLYANRVRVHWVDGNAYATPRLGLSIGAGLAWDWAS